MSTESPKTPPLKRSREDRPNVDGDLLARVYAGDRSALEALYVGHSGYVMAVALRILRDRGEAEEVVQDVFWQLWQGRARYDENKGRFTTWLFAIARSRSLDQLRRRKRAGDVATNTIVDDLPGTEDPEMDTYAREQQARITTALDSLSGEQRQVIELAFYDGLSHGEIAARTGEPLGTVKSRIKRGMSRLRGVLANEQATA